jgi:hypothetical protein
MPTGLRPVILTRLMLCMAVLISALKGGLAVGSPKVNQQVEA